MDHHTGGKCFIHKIYPWFYVTKLSLLSRIAHWHSAIIWSHSWVTGLNHWFEHWLAAYFKLSLASNHDLKQDIQYTMRNLNKIVKLYCSILWLPLDLLTHVFQEYFTDNWRLLVKGTLRIWENIQMNPMRIQALTHLPLVPHIYVGELGQHWFG